MTTQKCGSPWTHAPHPYGKTPGDVKMCPGHANPLEDPLELVRREIYRNRKEK